MHTEFYITTSYSLFSVFMYGLVAYVIIKNKTTFYGSYFNIILVDSAVQVAAYLATAIILHIPRGTCQDCALAPLLTEIPGLNFFMCLWSILDYTQHLMVLALLLNRFTAIVFPLRFKTIWKSLFLPLMVINIVGPMIFSHQWLTVSVMFKYYEPAGCFFIYSEPDIFLSQQRAMIPIIIVLIFLSTSIMVATFIAYGSSTVRPNNSAESRLLIYSVAYFFIQLFVVIVMVIPYIGRYFDLPFLVSTAQFLLPYAFDAFTFSSPYVLLMCSPTLRTRTKQMFFGTTRSLNVVVPIVKMRADAYQNPPTQQSPGPGYQSSSGTQS